MDHQSTAVMVSSIELAAIMLIRATSRGEWQTSIAKLVQVYDTLELTVSRKAADQTAERIADHYRERFGRLQESRHLIEAVFDRQQDAWQG